MLHLAIQDIKDLDVSSEEFNILFYTIIEKFVNEYDDMSQMKMIQIASSLLEELNS